MKLTTVFRLLILIATTASFAQQPAFELADVHVSPTARGFAQNFGGVLREGRYVNRDATMLNLITAAYDVPEDAIAGGPGWLGSDVFDVVAKVPSGTTPATAKLMLRSLLEDRFHLVVRNETHPVPRFVWTVGKNGPKLKPGSGDSGCQPQQQAPGDPSDPASQPNIKVVCHNLRAADIADNLRQMAGGYLTHDVIDQTKLDGTFDFDLEWTPRVLLAAKGDSGISIFKAVEKLGLKLDQQDVPLPSLVVVSVDRHPTPNPAAVATSLATAEARFEVATIKLADPNGRPFVGLLYTGGSQMRAGGTLRQLIAMALQISPNIANDMVLGLPKSADDQKWDITAKVPLTGEGAPNIVNGRPQPPPLSVGLEMLRGLLVDQFQMKTHAESREVTVYALMVASGKPKLTRAAESERAGCKPDPNAPKPFPSVTAMVGCKSTTMAELAYNLSQFAGAYIDHPIVDATGLSGEWDFAMGWTPKAIYDAAQPKPAGDGSTLEASTPSGITVFQAVEEELGLKLVKQKRTIPVIVVDHVNEKPAE